MIFRPELAEKVMAGEKTVTRRRMSENPRSPWWRERCRYEPGQLVTVNPGRGKVRIGKVRIVSVRAEPLGLVLTTSGETRREGFGLMREFMAAWRALNGGWDPDELVWRVAFVREG